jgi:hypothetical protein
MLLRRVLLVSALAGVASSALTLPPAAAAERVAVTGTYRLLVADERGAGEHAEHYQQVLLAHGHAYRLHLRAGQTPRSGQRVTVTGALSGGTLAADTVGLVSGAAAALPTGPAKTVRRVLVILASWTQPDAVTRESAAAQVFGDDDAWAREVSYGAVGLAGDVTPWVSVAGPTGGLCYTNHRELMDQAKAAAKAAGYDAAGYDRTILYFPRSTNPDCVNYGGWAYQPGTEVWLNGTIDRRSTMHEQGHAEGLPHAGALLCVDGTGNPVTLAATGCTRNDYGDPSDAMGAAAYAGHYSAPQKAKIGWLPGTPADLSTGGVATLAPYETAVGTPAATMTTPSGRTYWLEYRAGTGVDAALPAGNVGGLLVHMTDPAISAAPLLLDMTPDNDFTAAALAPGSSWTTPEGYVVTAGAPTLAGLPVTVAKVSAPGAVASVLATPGNAAATASWTVGPDGGSAVTAYVVTAAPGGATVTVPGTAWTATVGGLANGTAYTLSVRAVNALGTGPAAGAAPVTPTDTVAPGRVTLLNGALKSGTLTLRWVVPADADYAGVVIRMASGTTPPASPTAGTLVYSGTGANAAVKSLAAKGLYSFSVFAKDAVPNYSRGTWLKCLSGKITAGAL